MNIETIDQYIAQYEGEIQDRLSELRMLIKNTVPDATEKISWGMPTFYLQGNLVHFAANKNHIGFYPAPSGVQAFLQKSTDFKTSKGAIQFPHTKPLPLTLIKEVVELRASENRKN